MRINGLLEEKVKINYDWILPVDEEGKKTKKFNTVIMREYHGTDEEQCSQPGIREDIITVNNLAVSRCIAEIPGTTYLPSYEDVGNLPSEIVDNLLLKVRKLTRGPNIEKKGSCVNCKSPYKLIADLDEFRQDESNLNIQKYVLRTPIIKNEKEYNDVYIRKMTNNVKGIVLGAKDLGNTALASSQIIFGCIEKITVKGDLNTIMELGIEDISNMSSYDRKNILDITGEISFMPATKEYECWKCGTPQRITYPVLDFLF